MLESRRPSSYCEMPGERFRSMQTCQLVGFVAGARAADPALVVDHLVLMYLADPATRRSMNSHLVTTSCAPLAAA